MAFRFLCFFFALAALLPSAPAQDAVTNAPAAVPVPDAVPPQPEETVARALPVPRPRFAIPDHDAALDRDYIGHRYHESLDTGGWGWVRLPEEKWKRAHWVTLLETPKVVEAPFRSLADGKNKEADQDCEYVLHGYIAPYRVYDPRADEMLEVFVLESWHQLGDGPAEPLDLHSGAASRNHGGLAPSSYRSRQVSGDGV